MEAKTVFSQLDNCKLSVSQTPSKQILLFPSKNQAQVWSFSSASVIVVALVPFALKANSRFLFGVEIAKNTEVFHSILYKEYQSLYKIRHMSYTLPIAT